MTQRLRRADLQVMRRQCARLVHQRPCYPLYKYSPRDVRRPPSLNLARRRYATVTDIANYPSPGEKIHGFTLNKIKHVPELHLTALELQHDKTGADYLHVAREDKNNVFAINFKTNPKDDTGLPHILEHVTLCGSEKFPVRDPFFKMMPRSLASFMNAFTSADHTSYPFSTTNKQDFQNLLAVYLDATLHPLLKKSDFLQEGWRLGPENPMEEASRDNVQFKGVVYNEMKGQMSDASYLFYIRFRDHIFPAINNSGGDPQKMTDLTYAELVEFSKRNYHPSNSKIFSYGDLDISAQLRLVNEALEKFDKTEADRDIKIPLELGSGPSEITVNGPLDRMQSAERQIKCSISWLTGETSDIHETFAISLLTSLLMSGYGSPLYEGLIETGLGSNFSPNSGFDTSGRIGIYSIGLDGMKSEDAAHLKETIQTIWKDKSSDAFLPHKIEGYLHQLEIALKHKTASFGMGILEKTIPGWFNGVNPMDALQWNEVVDTFRQRLKQDRYLEGLLQKHFMNDKCLVFRMEPAEMYNSTIESNEQSRREMILSNLERDTETPDEAIKLLGAQELDLLEEQEAKQDANLETLPTLQISDIQRKKERKTLKRSKIGPVACLTRETETNGITYLQGKHLFDGLPDELRLLLPLFTDSLMRLGTKSKSVGDLEAEILLKTGGISVSPFTQPDSFDSARLTEGLTFSSYALDRNVPAMLDLINQIILDIDFNNTAPILELLITKTAGALDAVAETGHHFAVSSAAAALSGRGRLQDQLSGLTQLEHSARLLRAAQNDESALDGIIDKLKLIQAFAISNSSSLSLRLVNEPNQTQSNHNLLQSFLARFPFSTSIPQSARNQIAVTQPHISRTFFNLPFQVSYSGFALDTVPITHPHKAPLTILSQLLTHNYLHPEVREKGGAYGASASASPISSLFTMSSYRDPSPQKSLTTFEKAGIFGRDRSWNEREMREAKLGLFQGIDAPRAVDSDGYREFMTGITDDQAQEMRERLLDCTAEQVQQAADKYLVNAKQDDMAVCVLGEKKEWVDREGDWDVRTIKSMAA